MSNVHRFVLNEYLKTKTIFHIYYFTESGDESDCSVCSSISQQKHDGESNQPDSGFEEKKVSILCL